LHLIANHFPIIVPMLGLLIMIGGIILKSELTKRIAYMLFIFGSLAAIVAFLSGDGAEDIVEKMQGIDKKLIHAHEEIAEIFSVLSYLLGAFSLVGLWANWKQKSISKVISYITITLSLLAIFYAVRTGITGGQVRHTKIRDANSNQSSIIINSDDDDD